MDDNNIPTPPRDSPTDDQNNPVEENNVTGEDIQGNAKEFEVTPDMNIAPVKDEPVAVEPVIIPKPVAPKISEQKEPLFSFKGRDIRSGQKEEIPAGPMAQSQNLAGAIGAIIPPKPPVQNIPKIPPIPPAQNIPPVRPAATAPRPQARPPIVKTMSTATAPNAPMHMGDETLKPLRTYEGDVAEALSHKRTSTASIAIAESRKSTGEDQIGGEVKEPSHALRKILIMLASLILIGAGAFGAYYLYSKSALAPSPRTVPQTQVAPSIVTSDTRAVIVIDNMTPTEIINSVRTETAKPQAANTIKEIILVQTKDGQHYRVAGTDMANIMDTGAPDALLRSLSDDWMLGEYADALGNKTVFVIATIDYFQNAFAAMLQWESTMADDIKQYLYSNTPADIAQTIQIPALPAANPMIIASTTASSTKTSSSTSNLASSTPPMIASPITNNQPYVVLRGSFVDRIIGNKDVREFVTDDNKALFLYSFIDNTHLVISGSEGALSAILNRLEQQAFVR